jgi:hypothetical protein
MIKKHFKILDKFLTIKLLKMLKCRQLLFVHTPDEKVSKMDMELTKNGLQGVSWMTTSKVSI